MIAIGQQRMKGTDGVRTWLPAVCYYVVGALGYIRLGTQFEYDRPVTSILPANLWSSLANAGLLAHCIVAYMVRCQPASIKSIPEACIFAWHPSA